MACGEDFIIAEGRDGVDEADVEIAAQAAVLEGVVGDDDVGTLVKDGLSGADAVGIGDGGDAGEEATVEEEFVGVVVWFCGVASHDEAWDQALIAEEVCEEDDGGCFSGSACGDVAYGDGWGAEPMGFEVVVVVEGVSQGCDLGVEGA